LLYYTSHLIPHPFFNVHTEKCKPLKAFCRNDNLDTMVAALPPPFTRRFGEIVWAQGGAGFGWWPACIYDPRLTVGGARKLALKHIGKKHLVYFFGCQDAPFTVLSDNKCLGWEEGLLEEYDSGKTAKLVGKARGLMFEWALQAATAENEKPIEYRLDWNHEEDEAVIAAGKPQGQRSSGGSVSKPRTGTGINGKRTPPIVDGKAKKKIKKEKLEVGSKGKLEVESKGKPELGSKSKGKLVVRSKVKLEVGSKGKLEVGSKIKLEAESKENYSERASSTSDKVPSPASTSDGIQPTRWSNRARKPSARSHEDLTAITSIFDIPIPPTEPSMKPPMEESFNIVRKRTLPSSNENKLTVRKSSPVSKPPVVGNFKVFCKISRNDSVLESTYSDASAFTSSFNIGFMTLPCSSTSTFADARSIMLSDLDEDCLPHKWKFFVPYLGPMSIKQEARSGSILQFLKNATHGDQFGDGTAKNPLRVFIYEYK
jgi:hypothetical protein